MKNFIASQGYCENNEAEDAVSDCSVTIVINAEDHVDVHQVMRALVDTTRDFLDAIHQSSGCANISDEEKSAALAAMFLNPAAQEPEL